MRRVTVTICAGYYYTVNFEKRDGDEWVAANNGLGVMCHENKIAIYVSNWLQSGRVSSRYEIGTGENSHAS